MVQHGARKEITPGFMATAHTAISSCGTIQPRSNALLTQPAANRIDDAARPSEEMIPMVLTRPVRAQPAASQECPSQDHRACDRCDNRRYSPSGNDASDSR